MVSSLYLPYFHPGGFLTLEFRAFFDTVHQGLQQRLVPIREPAFRTLVQQTLDHWRRHLHGIGRPFFGRARTPQRPCGIRGTPWWPPSPRGIPYPSGHPSCAAIVLHSQPMDCWSSAGHRPAPPAVRDGVRTRSTRPSPPPAFPRASIRCASSTAYGSGSTGNAARSLRPRGTDSRRGKGF